MTNPITEIQLENAAEDAQTFEDVANSTDPTVTSRLGLTIATLFQTMQDLAAYDPKGPWVTATSFVLKDLVEQSGFVYVCTVAHTSGVFATDLAAGKWGIWQGTAVGAHASTHENGGGDEITVAGLSGELADNQPPKTHASTHQHSGADEIATATPAANAIPKANGSGDLNDWVTVNGVSGKNRDLVVKQVNVTTIQFDAKRLVLFDSSNSAKVHDSVSEQAAITASGVSGLDTGSETSDTWYAVWAISNGTLIKALLSASITAPTMPGGYTYKRFIGIVRNNAISNFINFNQRDSEVEFLEELVIQKDGFAANAWTVKDLAAFIPHLVASHAKIHVTNQAHCGLSSKSNGFGGTYFTRGDASSTDFGIFTDAETRHGTRKVMLTDGSSNIYYYFSTAGGNMHAVGFTLAAA